MPRVRCSYLFNTTIAGIEQADLCLLIGTNPRFEASLVNVRLRKRWRQGGFTVARIGPPADLTYPVIELGAGPPTLAELAGGSHEFCKRLEQAARPMLIVGQGALARPDGAAILASAREIAERYAMVQDDWCGFNVLHTAAARVGGLDLGLVPEPGGRDVAGILEGAGKGEIEVVFLLGADEIDADRLGEAFVIYQGHHGDRGAARADVILPGCGLHREGRDLRQHRRPAAAGQARGVPARRRQGGLEDPARAVRGRWVARCRSTPCLRCARASPSWRRQLAEPDVIQPAAWGQFGRPGKLDPAPFAYPIADFYRTDPISRSSSVMAECSALHAELGAAGDRHLWLSSGPPTPGRRSGS